MPIGVGPVGSSASLASENASPESRRAGIVDEQRLLADFLHGNDRQPAVGAPRRRRAHRQTPKRIGLPASSLIWFASLTSFSVSAANAPSLNTGQFW